jgi:hypothetical protein
MLKRCSICRKPYVGHGNNAAPCNDGRCCDECNRDWVLPLRIEQIRRDLMDEQDKQA